MEIVQHIRCWSSQRPFRGNGWIAVGGGRGRVGARSNFNAHGKHRPKRGQGARDNSDRRFRQGPETDHGRAVHDCSGVVVEREVLETDDCGTGCTIFSLALATEDLERRKPYNEASVSITMTPALTLLFLRPCKECQSSFLR